MTDTLDIRKNVCIMVVSCDKYSDLWGPLFELFKRFWPDCPFNVYLVSNHVGVDLPWVKTIKVGDDISWSDNLLYALKQITEEYFIIVGDDYFLNKQVDTELVSKICLWAIQSTANYVLLSSSVKPDVKYNDFAGNLSRGREYRASVYFSLFKKDTFINLLRPGENAWEFEHRGSVRSDDYEGFYSTYEPCFSIVGPHSAVIKGKWAREAVYEMSRLGIRCDLSRRSVMSYRESVLSYLNRKLSKGIRSFISPQLRRKAIKAIRGKWY